MAGTSTRRRGTVIVSTIMLVLALPAAWFCLQMIYAQTDHGDGYEAYVSLGLMIMAVAYLVSAVLAVLGYLSKREGVRRVARVLGVLLLLTVILGGVMQMAMFFITTWPLLVLTILYLIFLRPETPDAET